jgi:hypothetical protein
MRVPLFQSRRREPKIARTYRPAKPELYLVEIHEIDCECAEVCRPHVPSDSDQLSDRDMGILATLGAVVATVVLFLVDPAGTAEAFLATIGIVS